MQFDESKHPRDDEGKFTTKEFRQNTSYEDILKNDYNDLSVEELKKRQTIDLTKKKVTLSKSEWARFYKRLGEIQSGGYVYNIDGVYWVRIDNKLIKYNGDYVNPKVLNIIEVDDDWWRN